MKNFQPTNDAIVGFDDAVEWAEKLFAEPPEVVMNRALADEPAAFGLAVQTAKRTCDRLRKQGVSEAFIGYVFNRVCYAGALCVEVMRLGSSKMWQDLIEPADETEKGDDHE